MMKIGSYILSVFLFCIIFVVGSCSGNKNDVRPEGASDTEHADSSQNPIFKIKKIKITDVTTTSATVEAVLETSNGAVVTERGAAWSIKRDTIPSVEDNHIRASMVGGDGTFKAELTHLKQHTTYEIRMYARSKEEIFYSEIQTFTTLKVNTFKVTLDPVYASGTTVGYVSARVSSEEGGEVQEKGICWDTEGKPTVDHSENKSFGKGFGAFLGKIDGLQPATQYNVRAYAITNEDTIYSDNQIGLQTISKGNVTYFLHKSANPSDDERAAYKRIEKAFDTAVFYMNKFTSVTKHLDISYSPGTPTADGNINGHINMGANADYQRPGTVLHEIAHTVGVGTTQQWWNQLISDGTYQGTQATAMLRLMTQDSTAEIHGDSQHFWPYGINGEWEDTGEDMLYIIHCLIVQGMVKDGLPVD